MIRSGGGRSGEAFTVERRAHDDRAQPEAEVFLDDVTVSRNHALLVRRRDGLYIDDLGSLNGTYVNRRRIESHRLADGDELQVGKYKLTYLTSDEHRGRPGGPPPRKEKALTIGAVVKQLEREFPDISISKIRYLEDQKLLSPRRTPGGYRLYAPADVDRLRTILRLQRDEFLPLRVIRQELAAGRTETEAPGSGAAAPRRPRAPRAAPPWRCAGRAPSTGWSRCSRTPARTRRWSRSSRTTG